MEKDIQNHNNDEIEIDLVELFGELKKNIKFIGGGNFIIYISCITL